MEPTVISIKILRFVSAGTE